MSATILIETDAGADVSPYTERVVLDGIAVDLAFRWNERAAVWAMTLSDEGGAVLVDSIPVRTAGLPLTMQHKGVAGIPPGDFIALSGAGDDDPDQTELGARVVLVYEPAT